ncbi:DUF4864 domain-containing protein [Roseovarius sp. 217]|jgi:hypothetical protein|uniref:DUF4864 domain-containing protein n=1 Tax=Roseovarius sp. (strain 217) TaxID=314264 RepID=UPI0000685D5A|nr:DUF4864 domain-containing protein [Roseovarius sp. 217]EAQ26508.1 hypothetical protein ROS217_15066 [Roseovarius sp. 217]
MRYLILSLALALGLAAPLRADEGAQAIISAQIEAFLAQDVARAYGYATPFIQQKFGTPEQFGAMVRDGYPMVWKPSDVIFLDAKDIAGKLWQSVSLRDATGAGWIVEYEMVETPDGWRINGVRVTPAPDATA